MAFVFANPNPLHQRVGDCVVRAISIATGRSWDRTYDDITEYGYKLKDMPSSNAVWGKYLEDSGFARGMVYGSCPYCTVRDYASKHRHGVYILGTGTHVVAVKNGDYYDTWDSGDETPVFVWRKKDAEL